MNQEPQPPTTDDREAWKASWAAQGMPWRTEPEIDKGRQRHLAERRAVKADIERGIYPFRDENGSIKLTRADVEWLLATHESKGVTGPVVWRDEESKLEKERRVGLDLRGAELDGVDLGSLPLACLHGGLSRNEWRGTTLGQRNTAAARMQRANLFHTSMEGGHLALAHLEGAFPFNAHLEKADLFEAHLEGANLTGAHLEGASLRRTFFDGASILQDVFLGTKGLGFVRLAGVRWNDADLSGVDWAQLSKLGDEEVARDQMDFSGGLKDVDAQLRDDKTAVRANRQLATALRIQGLNEEADRFAYRAQRLQRQVLRRQGRWATSLGSWLLDLIAGYGYQPMRSIITYVVVVLGFAIAYFALGIAEPSHTLSWNEALVVSMTAFHGRGFFASAFLPGDPQAAVAAAEALVGLLIEITFIATFTQRFFAR